jgi:DNA polymerase-3 subunit beta
MKFSIEKDLFLEVLSKIQGITGRKSNLAITTSVLLLASDDGLRIKATDLETGFEGRFDAQIETPGSVALNSKKLFEICNSFPDDRILINEVENRWIEIGNDRIEYHIVGMNPDDFPEIPMIEDVVLVDIQALELRWMIERMASVSGSTEDKRAHITGTLFEPNTIGDEKTIRMVSTDGSRLAKVDSRLPEGVALPEWTGVLIPKKGLLDVNKFLDFDGVVKVGVKDSHFVVQKDSQTIIARLLEGDFPQYAGILQKTDSADILIDRKQFLQMLKRMSILASENYRGVIFSFDSQQLVIRSTNPDLGESKEDMAIEYGGPSMKIAFNPRFFIDALNLINDEQVRLTLMDEEKPCLLEGESGDDFLTVIMPMRI